MGLLLITTVILLIIGLTKLSTGNHPIKDSGDGNLTNVLHNPIVDDWSLTETNQGRPRRGEMIFSDEFNMLDLDKWEHEITMSGGGNSEFQMYHNNRSNSYVKNGQLYIKPTLTADKYGEAFLQNGHIQLGGQGNADRCTNPLFNGCERRGTSTHIINPIMSARLRTTNSFAFKYGNMEVKAKLPNGDWLWPAIWLMPQKNQYGAWPASGEIDVMESRGNTELFNEGGTNIGVEQIGSTLHFGPYWPLNGWDKAHFDHSSRPGQGFDKEFHIYGLLWTPEYLKFSIDGREIGLVRPGKGGFWERGRFPKGEDIDNPWMYGENAEMAPFDQKFYIILNLAVGGTNGYFPDNIRNPDRKPWKNNSPQAMLDFWNARRDWLPTWKDEQSALQIDYVRVWAL